MLGAACLPAGLASQAPQDPAPTVESLVRKFDRTWAQTKRSKALWDIAQSIRNMGKATNNPANEARGLARMVLVDLTTSRWSPEWEEWRDQALQMSAKLDAPHPARVEVLIVHGYVQAIYRSALPEGIKTMERAIEYARILENDTLISRAYLFAGVALPLAGQEFRSADYLARSALFAQLADRPELELPAIELTQRALLASSNRIDPLLAQREFELRESLGFREKPILTIQVAEHSLRNTVRDSLYTLEAKEIDPAIVPLTGAALSLAKILSWDNRWEEAKTFLAIAQRGARRAQDSTTLQQSKMLQAAFELRDGDGSAAADWVTKLADPSTSFPWSDAGYLSLLSRAAAGAGEIEKANRYASQANRKYQARESLELSNLAAQRFFGDELAGRQMRTTLAARDSTLMQTRIWAIILVAVGLLGSLILWSRRTHRERDKLQRLVNEQTESLRNAKENAESANRAKSEFLARINHEMRNPLTSIICSSELLGQANNPESIAELQESLHSSTEHLLGVIDEVLDITRIEAGELSLEEVDFSPQVMLRTVEAILTQKIDPDSKLVIRHDPSTPERIRADESKIRQILINLGANAARHTTSGKIEIECAGRPGNEIWFCVTDNGSGIPTGLEQRLFTPFQTTDTESGSGLGLYICKSFVQRMGGAIHFAPAKPRGASFSFRIPFARSHEPCVPDRGPAPERPPQRVLILDDEAMNRTVLQKLLTLLGYDAATAESWDDAMPMLRDTAFEAVLLDLRMPEIDGFEVARRIRDLALPTPPRILAMTGDATEETRRRTREAHFDGFLAKPIRSATLRQVLEEHPLHSQP